MSTDQIRTAPGRTAERELAEQYRSTIAHTADLVRHLTSLADRYDETLPADGAGAADTRLRVALMRTAAEHGRRLIEAGDVAVGPEFRADAPGEAADDRGLPALALDGSGTYALVTRIEQRAPAATFEVVRCQDREPAS